VVRGVESGITSSHGLIAHGRGEAFDYLLGEQTHAFASQAIRAAAARLRTAKHPVLSVNGNTAALVAEDIVQLSQAVPAPIEVNIFHASRERELAIAEHLKQAGAEVVLLPDPKVVLDDIDSNRRFVNPQGLAIADVVFVPLEEITVDLNPLSRTAQQATITIVDNVTRALPVLVAEVTAIAGIPEAELVSVVEHCDNAAVLSIATERIRAGSQ
jgi:4-phosphopantoate--beta-alanine ligase